MVGAEPESLDFELAPSRAGKPVMESGMLPKKLTLQLSPKG